MKAIYKRKIKDNGWFKEDEFVLEEVEFIAEGPYISETEMARVNVIKDSEGNLIETTSNFVFKCLANLTNTK